VGHLAQFVIQLVLTVLRQLPHVLHVHRVNILVAALVQFVYLRVVLALQQHHVQHALVVIIYQELLVQHVIQRVKLVQLLELQHVLLVILEDI
jgi:hypothetical protein